MQAEAWEIIKRRFAAPPHGSFTPAAVLTEPSLLLETVTGREYHCHSDCHRHTGGNPELMYLMNGYLVFKVHGGAGDPLTPLLQHSRPESELIFLKTLKKFFIGQNRAQKTGHQADTLLQKSPYSITACTAAVPFPAPPASPLKSRGCAPFSTVGRFVKSIKSALSFRVKILFTQIPRLFRRCDLLHFIQV